MRSRVGFIALGVVAASLAIALWLVLERDPSTHTRAAALPPASTTRARSAPVAADLSPIAVQAPDVSDQPVAEVGRASARVATAIDRRSGVRVLLRGHIDSTRTDIERAQVTIGNEAADAAWHPPTKVEVPSTHADEHGDFELDVTERALRQDHLTVVATHPGLATVFERVSTDPVARAQPNERVELKVTLRMLTAACVVRGHIATADGSTAALSIVSFEAHGDTLSGGPGTPVLVEHDGSFKLQLRPDAEHVLLAFASEWRPATTRIVCRGEDELELPLIVVDRGYMITGQALIGTAPFASNMLVQAMVERPISVVSVNNNAFAWCGERFEWFVRSARTNEIGQFALSALGNRGYALRLIGAVDIGKPMLDAEPMSVLAPADDVELAPRLCELHLTFFRDGKATPASFAIRERSSPNAELTNGYTADANGSATVWFAPGRVVQIVVADDTAVLVDGKPGERTFDVVGCSSDGTAQMRIDL